MQLKPGPGFLWKVSWSVFAAVFFILFRGYTFNSGDQEEHLPYVYHILNPSLYPDDYLVPYQAANFTVRFYYAWIVAAFSVILSVPYAVLLLQLASLVIFAWFTGSLAWKISRNQIAFVAVPILTMSVFNAWTTGGNAILDPQFTCTVPAMALGAAAVYSAYHRRYKWMALLAGASCLFQVLTGLQLFIILLAAVKFNERNRYGWNQIITACLFFLIASGPMLFPVMYRQFILPVENPALYHFVLFEFRNAHHYLPSQFPLADYIKTIFLFVSALLILEIGLFQDFKRFFKGVALAVIAIAIFYFIAFEVAGWNAIGKLQWFKSTVWLSWLSVLVIISFLTHSRIILRFRSGIDTYGKALPVAGIVLMILLMLNAENISPEFSRRYQFTGKAATDLQKMHLWIRENTPPETLVLIPPDDDSYLCEAQRGTPVAWKGIIHESWFLVPWYADFVSVYGEIPPGPDVPGRAAVSYRNRPDSLIMPSRKAGFRLIDLSVPGPPPDSTEVIHREGSLVLLHFRESK